MGSDMSSIVSKKLIRREIPVDIAGEPGKYIEFLKLSGKKLEAALLAKTDEQMHSFSQMDVAFVKAMQEGNEKEQANLRKGLKSLEFDVSQFGIGTLLKKSVRKWNLDEELGDDPFDQLDYRTAYWAAEQVIEISRPPTKADLKNSASASISP